MPRFLMSLAMMLILGACDKAEFNSESTVGLASKSKDSSGNQVAIPTAEFSFTIANGRRIVQAGSAAAVTESLSKSTNLSDWRVNIVGEKDANLLTATKDQDIGVHELDFSKLQGMQQIRAIFTHTPTKHKILLNQVVFIDVTSPNIIFYANGTDADGGLKYFWSVQDDLFVDAGETTLYLCPRDDLDLSSSKDSLIAQGCIVYLNAQELSKNGSQLTISAKDQRKLYPLIYGADQSGRRNAAYPKNSAEAIDFLSISGTSQLFTNSATASWDNFLLMRAGGITSDISLLSDRYNEFQMELVDANKVELATSTYHKSISLRLPTIAMGSSAAYKVRLRASGHGLVSNYQSIEILQDLAMPTVAKAEIAIDTTIPQQNSKVALRWQATDLESGIAAQIVEVKTADSTSFAKVADLSGTAGHYEFNWGQRKADRFEVRIVAIDRAGNRTEGPVQTWTPPFFNAALVTRSVECFFCHIAIEGDSAGIDFPNNVHGSTGENLKIFGSLFSTNFIPKNFAGLVDGQPIVEGQMLPSYQNKPLPIFPVNNQFPMIDATLLKSRMNGALRSGSLYINRTVTVQNKALFIDGRTQAFEINGEVFVDGDLILAGKFKGIGTIYAKNIYIVGDLIGVDSPFPFPKNPSDAETAARAAVLEKKDALYLGAIGRVNVGSPKSGYWETSYPLGYDSSSYAGLGAIADPVKWADMSIAGPISAHAHPLSWYENEVNRIDAFIYAGDKFFWRSHQATLLNGGFMAPNSAMIASVPYTIFHYYNRKETAINPRTGRTSDRSVIAYDWRLRVGGAGLETLKTFFTP